VHGQKDEVDTDEGEGEVEFAEAFVVHAARHFGEPVVDGGVEAHDDSAVDDVVKVADDEVCIVDMNIERGGGEHDACDACKEEGRETSEGEEHGAGEANFAAPDGGNPSENFDAGGDGNGHGGEHEQHPHPAGGAAGKHVMYPDDEAKYGDEDGRDGNHFVAEEGLAGVNRKDFGEDAEDGENDDVNGRVRVEPEEVLVEDGVAATGGIEEAGTHGEIKQEHDGAGGEGRQTDELNHLGGEDCPAEGGHLKPAHAGGAHSDDGGDDVDRAHDGGNTRESNGDEPEGLAVDEVAGGVLEANGGVGPPAGLGRAAGDEEAGGEDNAKDRNHPEGSSVEAGKGHVPSADHKRDEVVGEAVEHGEGPHEQHESAVHGEETVVDGAIYEIGFGGEEFAAHNHGEESGKEKEDKGSDDVLDADDFVVSAEGEEAPPVFGCTGFGLLRRRGGFYVESGVAHVLTRRCLL